MKAERLAQMFHETYERLAPEHGYKTRERSAVPWQHLPADNKNLMIAVCGEILENIGLAEVQDEYEKKKFNVLIVDDDDGIQQVVKDILEEHRADLTIWQAKDGRAGARWVFNSEVPDVDLIISDWQMPFDGIKMIHNIARWKDIPILMMTSDKDNLIKGLEEAELLSEVHEIFQKPLDFDRLRQVVDSILT